MTIRRSFAVLCIVAALLTPLAAGGAALVPPSAPVCELVRGDASPVYVADCPRPHPTLATLRSAGFLPRASLPSPI